MIACVCQLFNIPRGLPSRSRMEIRTSPKSPFHSSPELHTNHALSWRRTPSHRATGKDSIGRPKRTTKPLYAFPSTSPRDTAPTSRLGGPLGLTLDGGPELELADLHSRICKPPRIAWLPHRKPARKTRFRANGMPGCLGNTAIGTPGTGAKCIVQGRPLATGP